MRAKLLAILLLTASVSCTDSSPDAAGLLGAGAGDAGAGDAGAGDAGAGDAGAGDAGASGGADSGGADSGGADSGGADSGGARAGDAGEGGVGGDGGARATASAGCSSPTTLKSGRHTIDVQGDTREYILDIPSDYDPTKPYKLVFAWHPAGGSAESTASGDGGYYGLKGLANGSTIFVSGEGRDGPAGRGWYNGNESDVAFARAMVDHFKSNLCIDESRIFSVGWSFGGMLSFTLGCGMADVFRAIAPMSGTFRIGCAKSDHPIAAWIAHGVYDDFVHYDHATEPDGTGARDEILARNHCRQETVPTEPEPCVSYRDCDDGYPVTWCAWEGHHGTPPFMSGAIWGFFSQF